MSDRPSPHEITVLLDRWKEGDRGALQEVVTLAYGDLHRIAMGYFQRGAGRQTLQATGLISELYLKLTRVRGAAFIDRRHFYCFAAQLMRMVLVDYSRRARAGKRPSQATRVPLHDEIAWVDAASEEMLALNAALDELEALDERKVRVIELRCFLGCTNEEAAELLKVSKATVGRDLEFAKVWLYRRLTSSSGQLAWPVQGDDRKP